jgi:hypothetical protein
LKKLNKHIALLLLAAFSLLILPKELLHALYEHTDTVDVHFEKGASAQIGNAHEHCDVLQLSSPNAFISSTNFVFSVRYICSTIKVAELTYSKVFTQPTCLLRGPPVVFL